MELKRERVHYEGDFVAINETHQQQQQQPRLLEWFRRRVGGASVAAKSETTNSKCSQSITTSPSPFISTTTTTTTSNSESEHELKRNDTDETDWSGSHGVAVLGGDSFRSFPSEAGDTWAEQQQSEDETEMTRFKTMLQEEGLSTMEHVSILYALGRLSAKAGDYEHSLEYHQAEYEMTLQLVDEEADCSMEAVAKVLDGMAKIALKGLTDYEFAQDCYSAALEIRRDMYKQVSKECQSCRLCKSTSYLCHNHGEQLHDIQLELQENQRNIGRVLFEEGHVTRAVHMIPRIGNFV